MKYKLVIFDFDGTLANSFPWFIGVVNQVADTYKFKRLDASEFESLRGYSARQLIQHVGVPMWKIPLIGRHVKQLMARDIDQIVLFDGMDDVLRRLSEAGVLLAVVSSNSEANIRNVLGPTNAGLIKFYECGAAIFGKQAKFRKVLKQSGVAARDALCIGDEIRDIEAARRERIAFGAVAWGYTDVDSLLAHAPDRVFTRVEEIAEHVA